MRGGRLVASGLLTAGPVGAVKKNHPPVDSGQADVAVVVYPDRRTTAVGYEALFDIRVLNYGPQPATSVRLDSTVSERETQVSTWSDRDAVTCTGPKPGTCEVRDLPSGWHVDLRVRVRATNYGALTLTAGSSTAERDPDLSNNSYAGTIEVVPSADLAVDTGAITTPNGTVVGFTHMVRNKGPLDATFVNVRVNIQGRGVIRTSQGECRPHVTGPRRRRRTSSVRRGGALSATLAGGQTAIVDVTTSAVQGGGYGTAGAYVGSGGSGAQVDGGEPDPDPSNNSDGASVQGTGARVPTCRMFGLSIPCRQ